MKKLGIKPGHRLALLNALEGFRDTLAGLPKDVDIRTSCQGRQPADVILFFTTSKAHYVDAFDRLVRGLDPHGGLWICWPKKASKVPTDLTEDVIRDHALQVGLVDNKVCAVDDTWSGLRLVVRLADRPKKAK